MSDGTHLKQFKKIFHQRFLLLVWLASVLFLTLSLKAERLPFKIYTTENGLSQNLANRVVRDSHGFLWFCTEDGLSRFDGNNFVNYDTADGLPHPQINHILEARDGTFWLATNGGGVAYFDSAPKQPLADSADSQSFKTVTIAGLPEKNLDPNRVNYLFQDRQETIWAGTFVGLFRLEKADENFNFQRVALPPNNATVSVRGFRESLNGDLWMWSMNGVFRRRTDGRINHYSIQPTANYDPIRGIVFDAQGRIWIAHEQAGLFVLDENQLSKIETASPKENYSSFELKPSLVAWFGKNEGLTDNRIYALFQSSDKHLWVGTSTGLSEFDGANFRNYTAAQGLPETPYNWLAEDVNGNLWATTNQGAIKFTRHGFVTFQQTEGLGVRGVRVLWETAAGELRALTPDGKFHQLAGENFVSAEPLLPSGTTFDFPQNVIQDGFGEIWAATKNGLFRFPRIAQLFDLQKIAPSKIENLPSDFVMHVYEDLRHDIWISLTNTEQKLARWERATNSLHFFGEGENFPPNFTASAFAEDASGTIWIGSIGGGIVRYRNKQFDFFTGDDGVPTGQVQDLFFDKTGRLWIATKGGGVGKVAEVNNEKPAFSRLTTKDGIASDNVTCVIEDVVGNIYIGTGRGLNWIDSTSERIGLYTTIDGLNDSKIEIALRDQNDTLWFGTANSLARFTPLSPQTFTPPPIFITKLQIAGNNLPLSEIGQTEVGEFELDADNNQVMIEFSGINFNAGQTLRFQHKLVGTEENWSAPTLTRTVNFANLAPGNYQFLVQAVTPDGKMSQKPAAVSFKILPPLYLRWWFLLAVLLFVGIIIYAFYRSRLARFLELERVRTRIATDLHDDIGANLTRIALLSEVANQPTGNGNRKNLLPSIADIARESVDSMNDIVWAISPNHDRLLDLTRRMRQHAEEIFTYREIDLEFNAPPSETNLKLSVGVRRDLLMIFKEAVNNAARHSDCSKVKIDFCLENSMLSLRVADNGRGFDDSQESDGQGLRSMSRRAEFLGGKFKLDSSQKNGTSIEFELALQKTKRT